MSIDKTGVVYAAEEKTEAVMDAAVMSGGSEVLLGNDSITINGVNYLNSQLGTLLSSAKITRLEFNPAMAKGLLDAAKAAGTIITVESLKKIGVAVANVFAKMALLLALATLLYTAYQVVMEDGNKFNISFLPDSVFIGGTQINGYTKSMVQIVDFFEVRMKANPNEEVVKPGEGTDTGETAKPGEGDSEAEGEVKAPQYPGNDGTKSSGDGWEWRGNGDSSSGQGSWYNPKTGQTLHPDLEHPEPIGPHWDYKDPSGNWYRLNPDGSLVPK